MLSAGVRLRMALATVVLPLPLPPAIPMTKGEGLLATIGLYAIRIAYSVLHADNLLLLDNVFSMRPYNHDIYSQQFARLLNRSLQKGQGDPRLALEWLDKKYKLLFAVMFTRNKLEISDAYMDVREHIVKRISTQKRGEADEPK